MSTVPSSPDPGLMLPLAGVHLIEASAGTGKTFTLATLVLRLLLERGVPLPGILVVTFTRAATQELRERLRRRLRMAEGLLDEVGDQSNRQAGNGEAAVTLQVIANARAIAGDEAVRLRLSAALLQLDESAVFTIHGFCGRALRELGFRAGTLADTQVVDNADDVWREVAADLWRHAANLGDPQRLSLLPALWNGPDAFAEDLPKLCDPARETYPAADESTHSAVLHALRADGQRRFDVAMAARGQRSQEQLIEQFWRASTDTTFMQALAARWPAVLVDEFQDTDPRQWDIFRRLYEAGGSDSALILIGDPKQAIYRFRGGDLDTYLLAREFVRCHGSEVTLTTNYRSRPAVLSAIETVFAASPAPFVDSRIGFHPLAAGGKVGDEDLRVDGATAPGLTLHWLPPAADKSGLRTKPPEFAMMRAAAVHAVADLLARGTLRVGEKERPLRASDIAVLTQTNAQAVEMRVAFARAGIAAATLSNDSVFASEAASDLHWLLQSLAAPSDPARLRAALATELLGFDAASITALDDEGANGDGAEAQAIALRFEDAAERWQKRGPLPALLPFISDAAPRWLCEEGGARRLTDCLHLAELLQTESPRRYAPSDQLAWFARQCAAPAQAEEQMLRLESDEDLVQIATLHKSKGLEYPVVVLPFAAWCSGPKLTGVHIDDFHDASGRPARAWTCKNLLQPRDAAWIAQQVEHEERAEALRQLYVGLTRARYALHVVWSRNGSTKAPALHWLLHAGAPTRRGKDKPDYATMQARIERLVAESSDSIAMQVFDPAAAHAQPTRATGQRVATCARTATRQLRIGPWLHSFSALHARQPDSTMARGADDEVVAIDGEVGALGGTSFGNVVHHALESADFAAWRDQEDPPPPTQRALVERALLRYGLPADNTSIVQASHLVARALNAPLPGGLRLCDTAPTQRIAEMEFHFRLRSTRLADMFRLLDAHGYPRSSPRGQAHVSIEGLMHGYIDLVYRAQGRHYVLDYKTNRLPGYDDNALRAAISAHDYDLQYLIYLVALQRWLRFRRGAAFDGERDIGGAVYLFLRGIDGSGNGIHIDRPQQALIDALDALFDGAPA